MKNLKTKRIILSGTFSLISAACFANGDATKYTYTSEPNTTYTATETVVVTRKEPSFYLGGSIGSARDGISTVKRNDQYILAVNKSGLAGRVFAGVQFNENIGTELGYILLPDVKLKAINGGTAKQQALDLVLKGTIPVGNNFGLFAEGGVAYVDNRIHPDIDHLRQHKWTPTFGAGGSYDIQNVRLNAGWKRLQGTANFHNVDYGYLGAQVYLG